MEFSLQPLGFMEFLQNFCKDFMKPRGRKPNSMALDI